MAKIVLFVKYILCAATVLSAGFLIKHLIVIEYLPVPERFLGEENLSYDASAPLFFWDNTMSVLQDNYRKCIEKPSPPFCLIPNEKRQEVFKGENRSELPDAQVINSRLKNLTLDNKEHEKHIHHLVVDFVRLMEKADVKPVLIEPYMLYCLLSETKRTNLLKRGVRPGRHQGSRNVVTFAVFEEDSVMLNEENTVDAISYAGFNVTKYEKFVKSWDSTEDESVVKYFRTLHYLFKRQYMAVHVVVLYRRNSYFWHAGINANQIDVKSLLFVNDGIFERFMPFELNTTGVNIEQIFIPNGIQYFLEEVESSQFVQCRTNSVTIAPLNKQPPLTQEQKEAAIALRELKKVLAPHMVVFWLWSDTLKGWLEKCNIFHYSPTLQLSLTLENIEGLNLTQLFSDNEFLEVQNNTDLDPNFEFHLEFRGQLIKIDMMHNKHGEWWCRYSDGTNVYKLTYPAIELCSTDVFGLKVSVPCKGDIFSQESRQNWTNMETDSSLIEQDFSHLNASEVRGESLTSVYDL